MSSPHSHSYSFEKNADGSFSTAIPFPKSMSNEEIMKLFGEARVSVDIVGTPDVVRDIIAAAAAGKGEEDEIVEKQKNLKCSMCIELFTIKRCTKNMFSPGRVVDFVSLSKQFDNDPDVMEMREMVKELFMK